MNASGFIGFALAISLHERDTYAPPTSRSRQLEAVRRLHRAWARLPEDRAETVLDLAASPYEIVVTCDAERLRSLVLYLHRRHAAFEDLSGPVVWSAGISFGQIRRLNAADDHWIPAGMAVAQATQLARRGASGSVFATLPAVDAFNYEADEDVIFTSPLNVRGEAPGQIMAAQEVTFTRDAPTRGPRPGAGPHRKQGIVQRWVDAEKHGFLLDDNNQFFYFDERHLVAGVPPTVGQLVWFVPRPPLRKDRNPLAAAVVGEGDVVEGEMAGRGVRGARYARVTDQGGFFQDLQMHGNTFETDLDLGQDVRARVIAEPGGPALAEVHHASWQPFDLRPRRDLNAGVPEAFLGGLGALLYEHGATGAAAAVVRSTASRLPSREGPAIRVARARVLAEHAFGVWLQRALRDVGAEELRLRLAGFGGLFEDQGPQRIADAVEELAVYLDDAFDVFDALERDGSDRPLPAVELIRELLVQTENLNPFSETDPAHGVANHCADLAGRALGQLYLDGVVTAVAVEAAAVARSLDVITGRATPPDGRSQR